MSEGAFEGTSLGDRVKAEGASVSPKNVGDLDGAEEVSVGADEGCVGANDERLGEKVVKEGA